MTEANHNLLLIGPLASKLFLLGILDMRMDGVYFDGSNTTSRRLDVLEKARSKIICIDELEIQLLNFIESDTIKVDQIRRQYDFEIKGAKI